MRGLLTCSPNEVLRSARPFEEVATRRIGTSCPEDPQPTIPVQCTPNVYVNGKVG